MPRTQRIAIALTAAVLVLGTARPVAANTAYSNVFTVDLRTTAGASYVLFDDFRYDCVEGCANSLAASPIWTATGPQDLSASASGGGVLTFTLPAGRVGAGSGVGRSPQILTRNLYNGGLYAARVWHDDGPAAVDDPVVQTFWVQSPWYWYADKRYAECDFEYLAHDWWDNTTKPTMYMTTWEWAAPGAHDNSLHDPYRRASLAGRWVDLVMKVRPGESVEYAIFEQDGTPILGKPLTLGGIDGTYAPEQDSAMYILVEVWARKANNDKGEEDVVVQGTTRMKLDWVVHVQDPEALSYSWSDVKELVDQLEGGAPIDTTVPVSEPPGGMCQLDGSETQSQAIPSTGGSVVDDFVLWVKRVVTGGSAPASSRATCSVTATVRSATGTVLATATVLENADTPIHLQGGDEPVTVDFTASSCSGQTTVEYWVTAGGQPPDGSTGGTPISAMSTSDRSLVVIPASAHAGGALNTNWVSDAVLHNSDAAPTSGYVFLMKSGQDNASALGQPVVLPAGSSLRLADVVEDTFGESAATGAMLVATDDDILVTSRTFNNLSTGTFGQFIGGLPVSEALGQYDEARLIQLTSNSSYRTNIGFANATGSSLPVEVKLYRANGSLIGTRSYTILPYGYFQETDIIGKVTSSSIDDAYAIVKATASGATYFTYASVVDNRSGDPIAIMPPVTGSGPIYIPGAAALTGTAGTNWKTDLEVHNPGATQASYAIALLRRDEPNPSPTTKSFNLGPGQSVRYSNVLQSMFGFSGAATLRITPSSGQVVASGRTFNDQPAGTYGQFIAGLPESLALGQGQTGRLIQLVQSADDASGYRTNLGLASASGSNLAVEARFYRGDGALLGTRTYSLAPYESKQYDRVFRQVTTGAIDNGFIVLTTSTAGARFFAFASVVDNRSGDPVYIPAGVKGSAAEGTDELTVMLPGDVPLVLVRIPAGTFVMGSPESERGRSGDEGPQHQVTISRDFYMGKYEVTQRQWQAVMGTNPSYFNSCGLDCPVEKVSWVDICGGTNGSSCSATSFIGKVNQLLGTTKFRLPTEAEWEHAARGGTTGPFSFDTSSNQAWDTGCGSFPEALPHMWWCANSGDSTHVVGTKAPNAFGLFDMHGNVWEWAGDWYTSFSSSPVTDPLGPSSGSDRVIRGGSWYFSAPYCRSAYRDPATPSHRGNGLGFRLARSQ